MHKNLLKRFCARKTEDRDCEWRGYTIMSIGVSIAIRTDSTKEDIEESSI